MSEAMEAELARLRDAVSRMEQRLAEGRAVDFNDFAYRPRCRDWSKSPGAVALAARLDADDATYRTTFEGFVAHDARLRTISVLPQGNEPCWENWWLPGLDAVALYGMVALHKPRVFLEVGSGYSTRFVRRSIVDNELATKIVSIDPTPTQDIDALCNETIRKPLEEVDPKVFAALRAGDMLFVDNSHRSFQNSDVTIFFTEVLPALAPGVIYALHDIFLPFDYPESWTNRFYNEQYLFMAYLLGGADGDEVLLPMHHVSRSPAYADLRNRLFLGTKHLDWLVGSFWMRRAW